MSVRRSVRHTREPRLNGSTRPRSRRALLRESESLTYIHYATKTHAVRILLKHVSHNTTQRCFWSLEAKPMGIFICRDLGAYNLFLGALLISLCVYVGNFHSREFRGSS